MGVLSLEVSRMRGRRALPSGSLSQILASLSLWERAGVRVVADRVASKEATSGSHRSCGDPHPQPLSQEERGGRR